MWAIICDAYIFSVFSSTFSSLLENKECLQFFVAFHLKWLDIWVQFTTTNSNYITYVLMWTRLTVTLFWLNDEHLVLNRYPMIMNYAKSASIHVKQRELLYRIVFATENRWMKVATLCSIYLQWLWMQISSDSYYHTPGWMNSILVPE